MIANGYEDKRSLQRRIEKVQAWLDAPNLLEADKDAEYAHVIEIDEGWLYLAAVIDLFSRQVMGWSMQPHMQSILVTDALKMAWFRRQPVPSLIFHSDRGSQYYGHEFQGALASLKWTPKSGQT
jgi:transposase InsO family protein